MRNPFKKRSTNGNNGAFPELLEPDSVETRITAKDLKNPPQYKPSPIETANVDLVMSRHNESSTSKLLLERDWLTDIAQERGNPWTEVHQQSGDLHSLVDPDDPFRTYFPGNFIDPLTTKLKAKATSSRPIAFTRPLTPSEQDVGAAAEGRDIGHHYDNHFDRQTQSQDWVDSCIASSTTFLKLYWDSTKEALTSYIDDEQADGATGGVGAMLGQPPPQAAPGAAQGIPGVGNPVPQGQQSPVAALESLIPKMTGRVVVTSAPIGDIDELICPPFEVYPEPHARTWDEVGWLVHAKVRTLEYIREKFGARGWLVESDKSAAASTRWETRLDAITGDPVRTNIQSNPDTATVYEYWEKPTGRYPIGRLLRTAGGILLTEPDTSTAAEVSAWKAANPGVDMRHFPRKACDWPYVKNDDFPFVPLGYKNKWGTVWSASAVRPLVGAQRESNNMLSRMMDFINTSKPTILVPLGAKIKTDAFQSRRSWQICTYDEGRPPTYMPNAQSTIVADTIQAVAALKAYMEDSIGLHDPSNGVAPTSDSSGVLVERLKESDESLHAPFFANIEKARKQVLEWEIALCAQFYNEPRLVGISQEGDAQSALMNTKSFEHLTSGGRCRVEVVPGSAIPKSPDAERQMWMDLLKSGGFTPQMFPMLKAVIDQIGLEESDIVGKRLDQAMIETAVLTKAMNPQPDPAAAAQAAAGAAMAGIQAKGQVDAALKDKDIQGKITVAQIGAQSKEQETTQKLNAAVALRTAETQSIMQEHEHQANLEMLQTAHAAAHPTVNISFKDPGPMGAAGAEMLAGLPLIDHPADIAAAQESAVKAKQKPTPTGGKPSGKTG